MEQMNGRYLPKYVFRFVRDRSHPLRFWYLSIIGTWLSNRLSCCQMRTSIPLSVFLSKINTGEVGLAFAVATIYMVPTILTFLYGEEYLVDGISYSGSVKG